MNFDNLKILRVESPYPKASCQRQKAPILQLKSFLAVIAMTKTVSKKCEFNFKFRKSKTPYICVSLGTF
jgi:hypothetical protein